MCGDSGCRILEEPSFTLCCSMVKSCLENSQMWKMSNSLGTPNAVISDLTCQMKLVIFAITSFLDRRAIFLLPHPQLSPWQTAPRGSFICLGVMYPIHLSVATQHFLQEWCSEFSRMLPQRPPASYQKIWTLANSYQLSFDVHRLCTSNMYLQFYTNA